MFNDIIKLIIGNLEDKRIYRQMMKRVAGLPKDYRFAFRKIQHYWYSVGSPDGDITIFSDLTMFFDLLDLFETSAADGKQVLDVTGEDVAEFCNEFLRGTKMWTDDFRQKLNRDMLNKFRKEDCLK